MRFWKATPVTLKWKKKFSFVVSESKVLAEKGVDLLGRAENDERNNSISSAVN